MADLPVHIQNAAFEAHMSAAERIASALGIERAAPGQVAHALAHAYGEALGLCIASGATSAQIRMIGQVATDAIDSMITKVHVATCEGSA
ncbi:hypothetical protein M3P21_18805 [Ruegeria sp. 2012CJ41-6]|uniref:Uncharacterized protein n=1 Tax=Ruegeria spongiae TaxID=2942209 RepID=A0ABT0Q6T0_9RHOB|nr:hypothetical protein [Ruegeria spongiae]MCL6285584.1 hypothetical protein [Ruegeria spongiae]